MAGLNESFWRGRSVFVTGHTGFKGGWLVTWLLELGARVTGYAIAPDTRPSYFELCHLGQRMASTIDDIRNLPALEQALAAAAPEIVFHLAAQPLVRRAYREPVATFAVNVMGTVNVLEAMRKVASVRAAIIVTSDKCYQNQEWPWGYRESDRLGGDEPYSASKACAELVTDAYRRAFLANGDHPLALATVRAGNVIGGGDWAEDRLVPDLMRAFAQNVTMVLRNPGAVRPWQHVLEPIAGYLALAERLYEQGAQWSGAWNFGPPEDGSITTAELVERIFAAWGSGSWHFLDSSGGAPEARRLKLDCAKARDLLGWRQRLTLDEAIALTLAWYRQARANAEVDANTKVDMYPTSAAQIRHYLDRSRDARTSQS